jgi:very-short-patch-repair endonuclease
MTLDANRPPELVLGHPFRGSTARAAGLITPGVLRGRRFRRLFPDVYVAADVEVTLTLRARAAYLLVEGRGAVGGYAAAELLGASCGPADTPVDLVVPGRAYRSHPGLTVHRDLLAADEITAVDPVVVTNAARTAYDLACALPLAEAVVAVDALSNVHRFAPGDIEGVRQRHLGARGSAQLDKVIRLANPLSQSPMESRIRLVIVFDGLPVPVLQHPVGPFFLDMAYPAIRVAIEYDGDAHRTQGRAMRDLDRQAYLSDNGWTVLRFTAAQVLFRPWEVAARVRHELIQAARRQGVGLDKVQVY